MAKKSTPVYNCSINIKLVKSRKNTNVLILRAEGKFCSHESYFCGRKFEENLNKAFTTDRRSFVLNLAGITVLDAVGEGALVTFIVRCIESGTKLKLCAARQRVKERLLTTKVLNVVPYYETEEEALNSFGR